MINTRSAHTYAMRIAPLLLALLVIPLAQAYGILISGKDLNVVDANAYADYVIGRTALCIGTDCRTAWPAGIATILGVPPIVVSGTGDTRTIELNYDTTRGLAVENNQLYVPIGQYLYYTPLGAIDVNADYLVFDRNIATGTGDENYIPFWTGTQTLGTTNIYYDSISGRIGIGTASPAETLDVNGNVRASIFKDYDNTAYYVDPSGTSILGPITVGWPSAWDSVQAKSSILVDVNVTSGRVTEGLRLINSTLSNYLDVGYSEALGAYVLGSWANTGSSPSPIMVYTGASSIWLSTGGNIGIGTTAPSEKLDIAGNVKASSFIDRDNTAYYVDPSNTTTAAKLAGPLDMNGNSVINVAGAGYNALGCREVSGTPPSCSAGEYPAALWTDGTTWYALCCKK